MSKSKFLSEVGRYVDIVRDRREELEHFDLGDIKLTSAVKAAIAVAVDGTKNVAEQMAALERAWEVKQQTAG
jgi:hypothetical protein